MKTAAAKVLILACWLAVSIEAARHWVSTAPGDDPRESIVFGLVIVGPVAYGLGRMLGEGGRTISGALIEAWDASTWAKRLAGIAAIVAVASIAGIVLR